MIRVITDSMSDISQQEAAALCICVLPLTVRFGQEEFRDGVDLSMDDFYARITVATELPKTSQVTPESFVDAFTAALVQPEDEVLCITGSSKLSGTHQSAVLARQMVSEPERIVLLDSRSASLGEALLVKLALTLRESMPSAAALAAHLETIKARQQLVGQADELKYLVMGGRLSSIGGKLGTVLSIKPMLRLEHGKLIQAAICRGTAKARAWYIEQLRQHPADPAFPLMIAGAHCPSAVDQLRQALEESGLPLPPILAMEVGTVIGTHTGPGLTAL